MPPIDPNSVADDVGSDRLRGIAQIAEFLNEPVRRVAYLVERNLLPHGREGAQIIASKARLRAHHRKITGGEAA